MPTITPASTQRRTALQLMQTVLGELGLPTTGSILSTDDTVVQLLYLMNSIGSRLSRFPFWAELEEEFTITTVDGQTSYTLPVDWGVPLYGTSWDRTAHWPMTGPVTTREWQVLKSSLGVTAPTYKFRYRGQSLEVIPAPPADLTFVQEYLSTGWALGRNGDVANIRKPRITADSDYVLLDEELFIVGSKLAWKDEKGLDFTSLLSSFKALLEAGWANSSGARILYLARDEVDPFLSNANVPENGFGGV